MPQIHFNSVLEHFCEGNFFCAFLWLERCQNVERRGATHFVDAGLEEALRRPLLVEPPRTFSRLSFRCQAVETLVATTQHLGFTNSSSHLGTFKLCGFTRISPQGRQLEVLKERQDAIEQLMVLLQGSNAEVVRALRKRS